MIERGADDSPPMPTVGRPLREVRGFNYSKGRAVRLTVWLVPPEATPREDPVPPQGR